MDKRVLWISVLVVCLATIAAADQVPVTFDDGTTYMVDSSQIPADHPLNDHTLFIGGGAGGNQGIININYVYLLAAAWVVLIALYLKRKVRKSTFNFAFIALALISMVGVTYMSIGAWDVVKSSSACSLLQSSPGSVTPTAAGSAAGWNYCQTQCANYGGTNVMYGPWKWAASGTGCQYSVECMCKNMPGIKPCSSYPTLYSWATQRCVNQGMDLASCVAASSTSSCLDGSPTDTGACLSTIACTPKAVPNPSCLESQCTTDFIKGIAAISCRSMGALQELTTHKPYILGATSCSPLSGGLYSYKMSGISGVNGGTCYYTCTYGAVTPVPLCGDGRCNGVETATTCAKDCSVVSTVNVAEGGWCGTSGSVSYVCNSGLACANSICTKGGATTCVNTCQPGQTRNAYPDCTCITPPPPQVCPTQCILTGQVQAPFPDCTCTTPQCPNKCLSGQNQGAYPGCECSNGTKYCGDGTCNAGETCSSCASDCGTCVGCTKKSDCETAQYCKILRNQTGGVCHDFEEACVRDSDCYTGYKCDTSSYTCTKKTIFDNIPWDDVVLIGIALIALVFISKIFGRRG